MCLILQGVYPSSSKQLAKKDESGKRRNELPWLTSPQQYKCLYKPALYNYLLYIKLPFHYSGNTKCWQRWGLFDSIIHWWNKHNLFRNQCLSTALKKLVVIPHFNLDSILRSRGITLPTKVHLVKAMVFPVGMYGPESWTIKKAEHQRINAFELWCWRRLLRVSWMARRSNQSILNEINPEYSLKGLMLKLKLHYFRNLMWRAGSLEKTLMLKTEGRRRRRWQRVS